MMKVSQLLMPLSFHMCHIFGFIALPPVLASNPHFKGKNHQHTPQGLISGKPTSQYTSYSASFDLLQGYISKEHGKNLCNPSSR